MKMGILKNFQNLFFQPAVLLMNSLRFPQKFLLISFLFALPLLIVSGVLISEMNESVQFSVKELQGVEYLKPLNKILKSTIEQDLIARFSEKGGRRFRVKQKKQFLEIDSFFSKVNEVDRKYGEGLDSTERFFAVREKLRRLKLKMLNSEKSVWNQEYESMVDETLGLISHVGDTSNLILDPDLDTYYIMDAVLLKIPESQRLMAQILPLILTSADEKEESPQKKAQVLVLSGLLQANGNALNNGMGVAFRNNPKGNLSGKLEGVLQDFLTVNEEFSALLLSLDIRKNNLEILRQSFRIEEKKRKLQDAAFQELEVLLNDRIRRAKNKEYTIFIFCTSILFLVVYFWLGFYKSFMKTVSSLQSSARRMTEDNEMDGVVLIQTKDELGRVVEGFRNMALRLKKEWQQAQDESLRAQIAEKELKKARDKALEAYNVKSEFLATMSHEIRTPMNSIIGMADLLAETALLGDQKQYVETLKRNGENLLNLLNDILDLSKIEAGKMEIVKEPFTLKDSLKNVHEMLEIKARQKGVELSYQVAPEIPDVVIGDSHRLKQVLVNLAGNALKFTEKGRVEVRVECGQLPQEFPELPLQLKFSVQDTGIGISPEKIKKLFQAFTQADSSTTRKYGGTGLGLDISKKIIECMGGTIGVESGEGRGSCFFFIVPMGIFPSGNEISKEKKTQSLAKIFEPAEKTQAFRILLAEDQPDNRLLIQAYLKSEHCVLDIAENGLEALEKFKKERYDVVLLDLHMPVMDGYTAVKLIRQWEKQKGSGPVPVIALSASVMEHEIKKSLEAGCTVHLMKPVKKSVLLGCIEEHRGMRFSGSEERAA